MEELLLGKCWNEYTYYFINNGFNKMNLNSL